MLRVLTSTPLSMSRTTSSGVVNSRNTFSSAYLGLPNTAAAFVTLTMLTLIPGGAACFSSVVRIWSSNTSSLTMMMRSALDPFAQTVVTCP